MTWKNTVNKPHMAVWLMRFACGITKAADMPSVCNIYCFSMGSVVTRTRHNIALYCTYIACLGSYLFWSKNVVVAIYAWKEFFFVHAVSRRIIRHIRITANNGFYLHVRPSLTLYVPCNVTNPINKPTRCTFCLYLFYNLSATLHVSNDYFVHHQEFINLLYLQLCTNPAPKEQKDKSNKTNRHKHKSKIKQLYRRHHKPIFYP